MCSWNVIILKYCEKRTASPVQAFLLQNARRLYNQCR